MKRRKIRTVLVCGGRDYTDAVTLESVLNKLIEEHPVLTLVEGGARGADMLARIWAEDAGLDVREFRADWKRYGRDAGPKRNQEMLAKTKPDLVIAFPGGPGTADMTLRARMQGFVVWRINDRGERKDLSALLSRHHG